MEILSSYRDDCLGGYFRESLTSLRSEPSAKNLVTADNFLHRPLQYLGVDRPADTHGHGNMVDRASRMYLLQKPQSPLRRAERNPAFPRGCRAKRNEWHPRPAVAGCVLPFLLGPAHLIRTR